LALNNNYNNNNKKEVFSTVFATVVTKINKKEQLK
jgi:hypothetical protein